MVTTGAKYFLGLSGLAIVAAIVYGWSTNGGETGALTFGLYGGVGDHTGYTVLFFAAAVDLFLGGMIVAFRDADADAVSEVAALDEVPEVVAPTTPSYWPILGAVALTCAVLGLVVSNLLFLFGVIVGLVVLIEWMVAAWADRATGDPEVNRRIRNRIMNPIEVPLFGAIGIVALVLCVSRVLLAVGEKASYIVAIIFAALILATASAFAAAPKAGRTIVAVLCVLGALGVIAGGVIGAAEGSRTFEQHESEHPFVPPDRGQTPTTAAPTTTAPTTTSDEAN
jgi:hypothetical protein